jgi:hypothetical protein
MFERTHIPEAPWWVVPANNKRKARLNCMHHLLSQVPSEEIERDPIILPERERHGAYARRPVPEELCVPQVY